MDACWLAGMVGRKIEEKLRGWFRLKAVECVVKCRTM